MEYFDNAVIMGIELNRILTHEKVVPKSRRFIYTVPILNIWNREWTWIGIAFDTYPAGNDAQELLQKKRKAFCHDPQNKRARHPEGAENSLDKRIFAF